MVAIKSKDAKAERLPSAKGVAQKAKPLMLGHYRLIALLGEGSWAKVFRAEDTKIRRHVALKCIGRKSGEAADNDDAFFHAARAAAAVDHAGIVRVLDMGAAEGFRYIAMELIEGGTLAALIQGCGSLDVPRASQLCAEAAEALACAAEQGIVHGDIKPENLLLTRAGRCKIADFGLASGQRAAEGGKAGVSPYVAPEVAGGLSATEKSDVYSLAAVYYFLLTGHAPGAAADQPGAAGPDVRAVRESLPQDVAKIIATGMAKNPDERPMAVDLALQLRAQTIPLGDSQVLSISGPASLPEPTTYTPAVNRWELVSLLVGTIAVIVVVLAAWLVLRTPEKKTLPMLNLLPSNTGPMHPASGPSGGDAGAAESMDLERTLVDTRHSILASNHAALLEAAQAEHEVEVTGTVSDFRYDQAQRISLLTFAENTKFAACYRDQFSEEVVAKFRGPQGHGIIGRKVRVRGRPELIMNVATILIENSRDIETVE